MNETHSPGTQVEEILGDVGRSVATMGSLVASVIKRLDTSCRAVGQTIRTMFARSASSPALEEAIEASRWILDLKQDWDGEGADAVSEWSWNLAGTLLRKIDINARAAGRAGIRVPSIEPLPDGRVELQWDRPDRFLIVDIPADRSGRVVYYARRHDEELHGSLSADAITETLIPWLGVSPIRDASGDHPRRG